MQSNIPEHVISQQASNQSVFTVRDSNQQSKTSVGATNPSSNKQHSLPLKSDQLFSQVCNGIISLKEELERECDDISTKIDEIMRTELLTFDKLKDSFKITGEDFDDC